MANKVATLFDTFSIKDSISGIQSKVKSHIANMIQDSAATPGKVTLLTEAAVTHAGIVNANLGFYRPEKLKASTDTWLKPYNKPVLVDHDPHGEPIGRVMGSIYKATVPGVMPKVKNSVYQTDYTYRGLGHIQNLLSISDASAVDKILDGRYLTLSVHGDNDAMNCSICNQEWINDGRCQHRFGEHYINDRTDEEELAYWVAGSFLWDEVSFVNEPADPFAQILNREVAGETKDQVLQTYNYKDVTNLAGPITDSAKRFLKFYAVNDSKGQKVEINDSTNLDALYKIYDLRLHTVGVDLKSKEKESTTVADTIKTEASVAEVKAVEVKEEKAPEVKVADEKKVEAAVVDTKAAEPVKAEVKDEKAAVVVDTKVVDDKAKTAVTDATKPLEDKIKEHETKIKTLEDSKKALEDEKKALTDQATSLQSDIRNLYMNQILDMKEVLGTDTFASEEDRTKAKDAMATRSIDSIKDMVKDLSESVKKAKRPGPASIKVGDSGEVKQKTTAERVTDALSQLPPEKLIAMKMNGKLPPIVTK